MLKPMKCFNKEVSPILMISIIVGVLVVAGGAYYFFEKRVQEPGGCTLEAKICPDGSVVGRVGHNCEFAPCPESEAENGVSCGGWNTFGDIICECSGQLESFVCPSDAICDSGTDVCHGTCGGCKCYQGSVGDGIEVPCSE